jgi:hypothetical protein
MSWLALKRALGLALVMEGQLQALEALLHKKDSDFDYYDALPTKEGRALSTVQGT